MQRILFLIIGLGFILLVACQQVVVVVTATPAPTATLANTATPEPTVTETQTPTSVPPTHTVAPTPTVATFVSTPTPQRYLEAYYFAVEGPMWGRVVGPVKYYGRDDCEPLMMYNMPGETKQYMAIVRKCEWKTE